VEQFRLNRIAACGFALKNACEAASGEDDLPIRWNEDGSVRDRA